MYDYNLLMNKFANPSQHIGQHLMFYILSVLYARNRSCQDQRCNFAINKPAESDDRRKYGELLMIPITNIYV